VGHGAGVPAAVAVTTTLHPSPAGEVEAREAARRHGLPFVPRGGRPLAEAMAAGGVEALLVLSPRHASLFLDGAERRWSPGMGHLRMRHALARRLGASPPPTTRDPFLEAAGIVPGDVVVDATLGLGADALAAAAACGPDGRVVALEASPALAAWVAEGLRRLPDEPARRVEVRAGPHLEALAAMPDGSADVVAFDPMFRAARAQPAGFDVVRRLADSARLSAAALREARRVARRCVVVKDGAPGWDLARLGLTPLPSARGAHRYYARLEPA
jgi:hypothetical protein